jgi:RNA polymerase sigma factor (sigma-70 family)
MKASKNTDIGDSIRQAITLYEGPLLRYAQRLIKDLDLARDVVQETFLTLCRQENRTLESRLKEWLYLTCRNRALDLMRKEKRMQPLSKEQTQLSIASGPRPDEIATRSDQSEQASQIIAALPSRQQEIIRLKFQSGLSYNEISRIMDLSISNVGVILHGAIKKIRHSMTSQRGIAAVTGRNRT